MRARVVLVGALVGLAFAFAATPVLGAGAAYNIGSINDVSAPSSCTGDNAEVEQAVDTKLGYVYEDWMGCQGIGFARSTDGGRTFETPISLPDVTGSNYNTWDPAIAVGPDGTVYAVFMLTKGAQWFPVVDASFDHGKTFTQTAELVPPDPKNWGDRPFIAVGPDGAVYVTWDYGPDRSTVTYLCDPTGSCGFATGQLNVVIQKSTDHGKTFSDMTPVSPGFPHSGGDSGPMVIEPNGRIDVLYQGYRITNTTTYAMDPGYEYFTASSDGGKDWSSPVQLGPNNGTMSLAEWWIDGDIGMDSAGNLYAVWDTQGSNNDIGWLSYSTDHGAHWSTPTQVPPDQLQVPHVMEVAGGGSGVAYVSFFSSADPRGYADYLRTFSITRGWLSDPVMVSSDFGDTSRWPGDTFGISTLSPGNVVLSWGSATGANGKKSDIFAANVGVQLH
ncbi:MAG TPA: sialidase family protein [Gemmatimonadaceae bacterium]|nr:sialidase family protein [Gemmatimonadaceae bacterium]